MQLPSGFLRLTEEAAAQILGIKVLGGCGVVSILCNTQTSHGKIQELIKLCTH